VLSVRWNLKFDLICRYIACVEGLKEMQGKVELYKLPLHFVHVPLTSPPQDQFVSTVGNTGI
jgi:hypothetical protein